MIGPPSNTNTYNIYIYTDVSKSFVRQRQTPSLNFASHLRPHWCFASHLNGSLHWTVYACLFVCIWGTCLLAFWVAHLDSFQRPHTTSLQEVDFWKGNPSYFRQIQVLLAAAYFLNFTMMFQGHVYGLAKLSSGSRKFLQRLVDHVETGQGHSQLRMFRPLATVISSLSSGSWYSSKHLAIEDPVTARFAIGYELIARGMDCVNTRKYVAAALDLRLNWSVGGVDCPYEWRHLKSAGHGAWLFGGTVQDQRAAGTAMPPIEPIMGGFDPSPFSETRTAFLQKLSTLGQRVGERVSHDLTPKICFLEGKSLYFREIQVGKIS